MLITVITANNAQEARRQILSAQQATDGIELRLDYWSVLDVESLAKLRQEFSLPMIFTLRKKSQGGKCELNEAARLAFLYQLCALQPDFIDIEYDVPVEFIQKIKLNYPTIKLICSYHDFEKTPADLTSILQAMQNPMFDIYKLATYAQTTMDALRMLLLIRDSHQQIALAGMCMGEHGAASRILGKIVGSKLSYCALTDNLMTAAGQLTLQELTDLYHFKKLNKNTKIYVLLGDPVTASVGHLLHNQAIDLLQQNAIYLKLAVKPPELKETIKLCRQLNVAGCSVTMPLKESILPLLDELMPSAKKIQAVNSIIVTQKKWQGFNTDGDGAIKVLVARMDITKQCIAILGAGGAARAIAFAAKEAGASVIIFNRSLRRAQALAQAVDGKAFPLNDFSSLVTIDYTVLINTLPLAFFNEAGLKFLSKLHFQPRSYAMDIVYHPINTPFLQYAKQSHCIIIPGYEMYIQQALLQIAYWFNPDPKQMKKIEEKMQQYFINQINMFGALT
jgi:3-dehydroquinate dehydratase / shikimate dehydrogenase